MPAPIDADRDDLAARLMRRWGVDDTDEEAYDSACGDLDAIIGAEFQIVHRSTIDSLQETIKVERERRVEAEERAREADQECNGFMEALILADADRIHLRAECEGYRAVVEAAKEMERAGAELRRNINPNKGCGYLTYKLVWDASRNAEIRLHDALALPIPTTERENEHEIQPDAV